MPTAYIKSHLLQAFKLLWNTLLLASLAFNGLPLATAHAAPAKLPLPTGPVPSVTVGMNTYERTLIGEDFSFYVDFSNTGAGVGYGPFIDLIFPTNGIDGAPNPDGISFVSATFGKNAYALPATTLTFPDGALATPPTPGRGCVNHPFAVDATGTPLQICGTTGDTLVVLELPFSSVTSTMPGLDICVTAHISNLADVNTPLTILGRGGFRYGADNLDNPATDPVLVNPATTDGSGWSSLAVTPRVIYVSKENSGMAECPYEGPSATSVLDPSLCPYGDVNPTYESVTGKNYPLTYTIEVDAAAGQTINSLVVTDTLPNNIIILSTPGVTASGGTGVTITPPTYDILTTTPNVVTVSFASMTGSVSITIPFYIPQYQADNTTPIIDPTTGVAVAIDNAASAVGDWTPIDTRDSATPGNATADSGTNEINARSIAVQKSVSIYVDHGPAGYSAGDILQYKLDFQISDYFSFSTLKLDDLLSDGQGVTDIITENPPTFAVYDRVINSAGAVDSASISGLITYPTPPAALDELTITPGADGSTALSFYVSQAMIDKVPTSTGVLQGGYTDGATSAQTAHGEIIFYAKVLEDFSNPITTPTVVAHGDALTDKATVTGTIVDPGIPATYGDITDTSDQEFWIVNGDVTKHVYAVNGSTSFTKPAHIKPGDTITFEITQTLPSSDSYQYSVTDFVPLPILSVSDLSTTISPSNLTPSATPPAAGQISLGLSDSLYHTSTLVTVPPTISIGVDAASNSVTFDYGSISDSNDDSTIIDLLYTLTMNNTPYADNATLSSLAFATEGTTNNGDFDYLDADQFVVMEPAMNISKGVVAGSDSSIVFVPAPAAPVTFTVGANPSWSGVIASLDNNPSTDIINSDAQQVAIGSTVTFAVVLENLGHSANGVFDVKVKDSLPTGMQIPTTGLGLNLQVRRGDGTALSSIPVGATTATDLSGLFEDGIAIANDTSVTPNKAIMAAYSPTSGQNIIVITYDLTVGSDQASGTQIVNTATELNYSSTLGGPDYVGNTPTANINSDDATLTLPDAAPVIQEGASTTVNMSENDSPTPFALTLHAKDANGDSLTWSILSPADYGTAGVDPATGVVSYTPFQNYSGLDSFVVQVSDGRGGTDQINVNLKIDSVLVNSDLIWNQSYGIKYDSWIGVQDANAFGGNYREARSGVFTVKPPQLFTQFTWITYRGPDQGKARVYVDGKPMGIVDLYSPTANWQYPVVIKGLINKPHTIVIKPMNAHNPKSSDTWVVVDGFKIRTLTLDDNRIGISGLYSYGTWLGLASRYTRFGHYRISSEKYATMQFSFLGTRFNWVTARGPQLGKALIYVDGLPVKTVDLYSAKAQWQYRVAIQYLPYGNHVIQIKVLHTKNAASKGFGVICDGFEID